MSNFQKKSPYSQNFIFEAKKKKFIKAQSVAMSKVSEKKPLRKSMSKTSSKYLAYFTRPRSERKNLGHKIF